MPIYFSCPKCNFRIGVPRKFGGKRGECPECKGLVRIPESQTRGGSTESQALPALRLTASSEQELFNTLAPDAGGPRDLTEAELEAARQQLEFEKAKLEYDRRKLASGQTHALDDEIDCPDCAEKIKAKARVCRFCGYDVEKSTRGTSGRKQSLGKRTSRRRKGVVPSARVRSHGPSRSPGLALFLSFLVAGFGQIYAGDAMRGLGVLCAMLLVGVASAFTAGLGCIVWFPLYIWQMVDAYQLASRPTVVGSGRVVTMHRDSGTGLLIGIGVVFAILLLLVLLLLYPLTRPRGPRVSTQPSPLPTELEAIPSYTRPPVAEPRTRRSEPAEPLAEQAESDRQQQRARSRPEEQVREARRQELAATIRQLGEEMESTTGLEDFMDLEQRILQVCSADQVQQDEGLKALATPILTRAQQLRATALRDTPRLIEQANSQGDLALVARYLASLAKLRPLSAQEELLLKETLADLEQRAQEEQARSQAEAKAKQEAREDLVASIEAEVRHRAEGWFEERDVRKMRCRTCDGTAQVKCGECSGRGTLTVFDPLQQRTFTQRCDRCNGQGVHGCTDDLCMDGYRKLSYRSAFWNYLSPSERSGRDRRDFYRQLHEGRAFSDVVGKTLVVRSFRITGVHVDTSEVRVEAEIGWNRAYESQSLPAPEAWTSVWIREGGRYYLKTPGAAAEPILPEAD